MFVLLTIIVAGLAVSSNFLINHLRKKETDRIKSLATAVKYLQDNNVDSRLNDLSLNVIDENKDIPIIITDKNRNLIESKNIDEEILNNPEKLKQKIAEMGNTDADQVKLHFEVRRSGKPVDPLKYLPQR